MFKLLVYFGKFEVVGSFFAKEIMLAFKEG